jgi:hypothetical protein
LSPPVIRTISSLFSGIHDPEINLTL